jgi:hypothetical protein
LIGEKAPDIMFGAFLKVVDMDIKSWFSSQGSYADGLLYSNCLVAMLLF